MRCSGLIGAVLIGLAVLLTSQATMADNDDDDIAAELSGSGGKAAMIAVLLAPTASVARHDDDRTDEYSDCRSGLMRVPALDRDSNPSSSCHDRHNGRDAFHSVARSPRVISLVESISKTHRMFGQPARKNHWPRATIRLSAASYQRSGALYGRPQKPLRFLYAAGGRSTYRLYIHRAYRPAIPPPGEFDAGRRLSRGPVDFIRLILRLYLCLQPAVTEPPCNGALAP